VQFADRPPKQKVSAATQLEHSNLIYTNILSLLEKLILTCFIMLLMR